MIDALPPLWIPSKPAIIRPATADLLKYGSPWLGVLPFSPSLLAQKRGGVPLPDTVSGLMLWLRADLGVFQDAAFSTPAASGDPVGGLQDQSGNENHFTQATAGDRPVRQDGVVNGQSVLRFDGSNHFLNGTMDTALAYNAFIVLKVDVDPPVDIAQSGLWCFSPSADSVHWPLTETNIWETFGSTARRNTGDPATDLTQFNLYRVSSASGAYTTYLNGTQHFTTATNTVGMDTTPKLGQSIAATRHMDGDIAELLIYDSILSGANLAVVHAYINDRYNITIA